MPLHNLNRSTRFIYAICGATVGAACVFAVMAGTMVGLAAMGVFIALGAVFGSAASVIWADAFWNWLSRWLRWLS